MASDQSNYQSPLNEGHYEQLQQVLQAVAAGKQHCERCQAAGLDVSHWQTQLDQQHAVATGLKTQFFPDRA